MSAITLFKPCGTGNFEWLRLGVAESAEFAVGDAERLSEESEAGGAMVLIAPAQKIGLRVLGFEASEKKLLRQTIPYSLEEDLVDDVDSLHFALGRINESDVDVAYVNREELIQWRDQCAGEQVDVQQIIPEIQLLPYEEGSWTILAKDDVWLVRFGISQGFAMDPATCSLALQLLLDNADAPPLQLLIYAEDVTREAVSATLPELLRGIADWQTDDYWSMVARGFDQQHPPINLLQGEFAVGIPWKKWWMLWKTTAILALSAVVVSVLFKIIAIQVLESKNLDLRADIEKTYRSVIPRGAVVRPAQQLRRKVEELGGGGGERFMPLLERSASILTSTPGVELQTLNYNEKQSELRLTILTNGFNDVENVRVKLEQAGLQAELTGSNAEGSKTRARLRIVR